MVEARLVPYPIEAYELSGDVLDAMVAVYVDANEPCFDGDRRRGLFVRHTLEPGWQAVAAGAPPVAFAYGFHCTPGQWWRDSLYRGLRRTLGRRAARGWLADTFCLAELHVHPNWQRYGLGRGLLDTLFAGREERAALLTTPDDAHARKFYAHLGFVELMSGFTFAGTPAPYTVLGRSLEDR